MRSFALYGAQDDTGKFTCSVPLNCCLRIRAVRILASLTILHQENKDHDGANDGNKGDQKPPPSASGIVKPARPNCNTGNQHREGIEPAKHAGAFEDPFDETEHECDGPAT